MKENRSACSKSSDVDPAHDVELGSVDSGNVSHGSRTGDFNHGRCSTVGEWDHERAGSSCGITIPRRQRQGALECNQTQATINLQWVRALQFGCLYFVVEEITK